MKFNFESVFFAINTIKYKENSLKIYISPYGEGYITCIIIFILLW